MAYLWNHGHPYLLCIPTNNLLIHTCCIFRRYWLYICEQYHVPGLFDVVWIQGKHPILLGGICLTSAYDMPPLAYLRMSEHKARILSCWVELAQYQYDSADLFEEVWIQPMHPVMLA